MIFMKEYKVLTAKTPEEAETAMNQMARQGWAVKEVTQWDRATSYRVMITFEKDA